MSSNQRKPSIQPRATKASMLRLQKQQSTSSAGLVSHTETPPSPATKADSPSRDAPITTKRSSTANNASASEGVKAFMAQQRARLAKKPSVKAEEEEPVRRRTNVMTGAQRYGGGSTTEAPVVTQTRNIQIVLKQAKAQGKLNLSSRGLTEIPKEVLQMYHVDPKSIVVDFTSDSAAWYDAVELTKFVAGDNAITVIDEQFGEEFGALTHIDFRSNKLTGLPQSLKLLQNLTSVLLSYNQFKEIPKVLGELTKLKELDLSHNELEGVVLSNSTIEKLDLSHNKIKSMQIDETIIDDRFGIRTLDLGHNQIDSLPANVISWKKLQELKVNHNRLKFLFSATNDNSTLPSIIRLDAGNNLMSKINEDDKVIVSMPELTEFSLSNNKFDEEGLIGLHGTPNVQTLDISSNQLQYIPAAVTNLTYLQRIDVRGNQLHALPYELGKLNDLKAIQCEGNPMRSFSSMSQVQLIESLRSNYKMQLEEESKESMDDELQQEDGEDVNTLNVNFTQKVNITKRLDLSKQQLQELAAESMKFTEDIPGIILLNNNALTVFPSRLNTIASFIVQLNLEQNKLTSFDFTIDGVEFSSLRVLKLSNNRISEISSNGDTVSFPALEELYMNHNALTTLPENLPRALPALKLLALSSNKLDNITEQSFGPKLEHLDLSNNDIGYLPPGLSNLSLLKQLSVYGNRFRVPRPAVVDQGTQAILDFLRRRNNANNNN